MRSWEWFAAAAALVAGLWGQVKSVAHWLAGLVVVSKWCDHAAATIAISHLYANGRRSTRDQAYGAKRMHVNKLGQHAWVVFEDIFSSGGVLWLGWWPIWVHRADKGRDVNDEYRYVFSFARGTVDWVELLRLASLQKDRGGGVVSRELRHRVHFHHGKTLADAPLNKNQRPRGTNYTYSWDAAGTEKLLHWRPEDVLTRQCALEKLALSPEQLSFVDRVRTWHDGRDWYATRGIAWRCGFVFSGAPGTGKTSVVRGLAIDLDLPVHVMDLASMSNEDLREAWTEAAADDPCVVLIEDVDAVFRGRQGVSRAGGIMSSGGLTFDALLNCVDGVERVDGVVLVLTTNHLEHLDPALLRPGRVDLVVEFGALDLGMRQHIARRILGDGDEALRMAAESPDVAGAVFVNECCHVALARYYAKREGPYR